MLESAETGHRISKKEYARAEPKLREALLNAQFDLSQSGRGPVLLIISGVEGGGRGETANQLTEWMDPRHIRVLAFGPPTPEEKAHAPAWRYWQALPPKGRIGIFMNAWYNETLARMLTDEGLVLLKLWIHLSKSAQRERMRELARNPRTRWRVTRDDRTRARIYAKSHDLWEQLLRETSTAEAPWYVVEGADERYRSLTVGKILLGVLERTLAKKKPPPMHTPTPPAPAVIDNVKLIRDLDLTQKVSEKKYDRGVERVEGYCTPSDWMRAHDEINQFEEQLADAGAIVVKFWLQISEAEQARRFREREKTALKRFKITPDDWRNRKKWGAYEATVSDLVDRTSTEIAPWTLVEADDKYFARLKIFKTIIKRLEAALE